MVSLLTTLIIQGNDVDVRTYCNNKSQKWGYEISRMENGNYRPLLRRSAVYESEIIARENGEGLIKQIKSLDLSPQKEEVREIIGEDTSSIIEKVVNSSRD